MVANSVPDSLPFQAASALYDPDLENGLVQVKCRNYEPRGEEPGGHSRAADICDWRGARDGDWRPGGLVVGAGKGSTRPDNDSGNDDERASHHV